MIIIKFPYSCHFTTFIYFKVGNLNAGASVRQKLDSERNTQPFCETKNLRQQTSTICDVPVAKAILKTHSDIYQQFADESEHIKIENQQDYRYDNNENNLHQQDQDLHFAKRLTWNLPTEDKMQTSTDGNDTPLAEPRTTNLNLILSHSSSSSQVLNPFHNNQGMQEYSGMYTSYFTS